MNSEKAERFPTATTKFWSRFSAAQRQNTAETKRTLVSSSSGNTLKYSKKPRFYFVFTMLLVRHDVWKGGAIQLKENFSSLSTLFHIFRTALKDMPFISLITSCTCKMDSTV